MDNIVFCSGLFVMRFHSGWRKASTSCLAFSSSHPSTECSTGALFGLSNFISRRHSIQKQTQFFRNQIPILTRIICKSLSSNLPDSKKHPILTLKWELWNNISGSYLHFECIFFLLSSFVVLYSLNKLSNIGKIEKQPPGEQKIFFLNR